MKQKDFFVILVAIAVGFVFWLVPGAGNWFVVTSKAHPFGMSFAKFAVLATFGEMLALRIRTGNYNRQGFGVLPKTIAWGLLGIVIYAIFVIFANGTANFLNAVNWTVVLNSKVLTAFCISTAMNLIFAPMLMVTHKITDIHIDKLGGSAKALFTPIDMADSFKRIDWDVMWNFVFKKTIPLFWIPAHTITFLLPREFRVLFAAFLSIVLGVILSLAVQFSKEK
jgi:hypothetical protein